MNNIQLKLVTNTLEDGKISGAVLVYNSNLKLLDSYELGAFKTRAKLFETFEEYRTSFYKLFSSIVIDEIQKGGLAVGEQT